MSARLRVAELRAELQRRGLDVSGTKPALVSPLAFPQVVRSVPQQSPSCYFASDFYCGVRGPAARMSAKACRGCARFLLRALIEASAILVTLLLQCPLPQVRRLDAAICEAEKAVVAAAPTSVANGYDVAVDGKRNGGNNKRKRSGDGGEEGNGDTCTDVTKLEGMSYRELQGLAKARGVAANGGKKDVIQRLLSATADPAAVADGGPQGEKEVIKGLQF
jgi:hypothetical protein